MPYFQLVLIKNTKSMHSIQLLFGYLFMFNFLFFIFDFLLSSLFSTLFSSFSTLYSSSLFSTFYSFSSSTGGEEVSKTSVLDTLLPSEDINMVVIVTVANDVSEIVDNFRTMTTKKQSSCTTPCLYKGKLLVGQIVGLEIFSEKFIIESLYYQSDIVKCQLLEEEGNSFEITANSSYFFYSKLT